MTWKDFLKRIFHHVKHMHGENQSIFAHDRPILIFSNTSPVHPSSFQPLSCSFIHLPSQVPTSSNIHVRHVTKIHAAGEGQLHHSSLLVGCQSGIKPTVHWKSVENRSDMAENIILQDHGTFVTISSRVSVSQVWTWDNQCSSYCWKKLLHHLRCSKPCTLPLSSVGRVPIGVAGVYPTIAWCYTFQVMRDFFYQSEFIGEL